MTLMKRAKNACIAIIASFEAAKKPGGPVDEIWQLAGGPIWQIYHQDTPYSRIKYGV
jgi:hypothetical protein